MSSASFQVDHLFDGGVMDCGSGLILLIRQNILQVPAGGIMELRSREPSVGVELPPWCRMVGHEHLATTEEAPGQWRHFLRRGRNEEITSLQEDKAKAKGFEWRLRARHTGLQEATLYARNFSWKIGQPVSFEEKDNHPSALESALGALLAELLNGFASRCSQANLVIDDLEGNIRTKLNNVLSHLELEPGDPSLEKITLTAFVTSPAKGADLRFCWERTLTASPLFQTFRKATDVETRLTIL